jgi:benzoate/toluate 1,2-dioxygenase alpha subunit
MVDQSPEGLEVLRGSPTYVYDGNWKLQSENGADGYHVSAVHWNYLRPRTGASRLSGRTMSAP